ncbi:MAG: hypothetical protein NT085_00580 [candidate division SR1 bacterium]|nr:hypothetical protein [candidate division SR1 bacterium]
MKEDSISEEITNEFNELLEDSEGLQDEKEDIVEYINNPYGAQCTAKY